MVMRWCPKETEYQCLMGHRVICEYNGRRIGLWYRVQSVKGEVGKVLKEVKWIKIYFIKLSAFLSWDYKYRESLPFFFWKTTSCIPVK